MPLYTMPAAQAVETRKNNPNAGWGSRGSENRVEPFARPAFHSPFKLEPGERIFTIGSCFARNVETELMKRGFAVPGRELFKLPEFNGIPVAAVNNFGTPSIHNEFSWALEGGFKPEDHILPVRGGFVDMHLVPTLRPEPFEVVAARRQLLLQSTATVASCRVVIMTLGLVECWFDRQTGYYLNVAPRPSLLKDFPDRFELHVLSYDEAYEHLDKALTLLKKHNPDQHVILTVSPVPLALTHRDVDVMVANSYSKSALRAVAEAALANHPQTIYYPSYESVVLSDRQRAWKDDLVHVTDEIVAMNVSRMMDAYAGAGDQDTLAAELEAGGEAVAVAKAAEGDDAFFKAFGHLSGRWPAFAVHHARFLLTKDSKAALKVLNRIPKDHEPMVVAELRSTALLRLDRPAEGAKALEAVMLPSTRVKRLWERLIRSYIFAGMDAEAQDAAERYSRAMPTWTHHIPLAMARGYVKMNPAKAAEQYEIVAADTHTSDQVREEALEYVARFKAGEFTAANDDPPEPTAEVAG